MKIMPLTDKDCYKTLGVSKDTTLDELKKARNELLLKNHEDKNSSASASIAQAIIAAHKHLVALKLQSLPSELEKAIKSEHYIGFERVVGDMVKHNVSIPEKYLIQLMKDHGDALVGRAFDILLTAIKTTKGNLTPDGTLKNAIDVGNSDFIRKICSALIDRKQPIPEAYIIQAANKFLDLGSDRSSFRMVDDVIGIIYDVVKSGTKVTNKVLDALEKGSYFGKDELIKNVQAATRNQAYQANKANSNPLPAGQGNHPNRFFNSQDCDKPVQETQFTLY